MAYNSEIRKRLYQKEINGQIFAWARCPVAAQDVVKPGEPKNHKV